MSEKNEHHTIKQSTIIFIWERFEYFIRRTMLPSSIFFFLLFVVDNLFNTGAFSLYISSLFQKINSFSSFSLAFTSMLILLLSVNYFLKIFSQVLFDNHIKENYNSYIYKKETKTLIALREEVILKLKKENRFKDIEFNDYLLYQILGRILNSYRQKTDTRRYVTDVKEVSVLFTSLIVVVIWCINLISQHILISIGLIMILSLIIFYVGIEIIKFKFRSRAFRIYTNYLLGDISQEEISVNR